MKKPRFRVYKTGPWEMIEDRQLCVHVEAIARGVEKTIERLEKEEETKTECFTKEVEYDKNDFVR